ncbi:MAG: TraC family protein, partial [Pseudomonadota bacterium]
MAYDQHAAEQQASEEGYKPEKAGLAPLLERASAWMGRIGGGILGADGFTESFRQLEQRDRLSAMLPYRIYDPATMLFHNRASTGWVVELSPVANGDDSFISLLKEWAIDDAMTRGVVQFINWSSPRIAPLINEWAAPRRARGGVYAAIADARAALLEDAAWTSLTNTSPFLVREWRAFISLSFPGKPSTADVFELQALRDKLEGTLGTARVAHARIDDQGLVGVLDDMLNPRRGAWGTDVLVDDKRMLDVQCVRDDTAYTVGSSGLGVRTETLNPRTLEIERDNFEWRMFQIRGYPKLISSWTAPLLIGHPTTDTLRHSGSVLSCMTLSFGGADLTNGYATTKLASSVRSAEGPMAKIDPSLGEKAQDWRDVVSDLQSGDRLVRAAHTVGVLAPQADIEKADRSVRSIYKNLGLDIAKGSRVQRPLLAACMPMNGGDGAIQDLKTLQLTRRMVAQTAIALAPLHGEPRGSDEPVLLMVGRRGQPWMWSPFQNVGEGNHNVGIFGASGSGKSVLLQELASAHAATGDVVVVQAERIERDFFLRREDNTFATLKSRALSKAVAVIQ